MFGNDELNVRIVETDDRGTEEWNLVHEIGEALNDVVHSFVRLHVLLSIFVTTAIVG
jgi:hypothetical protein